MADGLGLASAYGAGAGADELARIMQQRLLARQFLETVRAHQADEANKQQQLHEQAAYRAMQQQELNRAHTADEATRGENSFWHGLSVAPPEPGQELSDQQAAPIQKYAPYMLRTQAAQPAQPSVPPDFVGPTQGPREGTPENPAIPGTPAKTFFQKTQGQAKAEQDAAAKAASLDAKQQQIDQAGSLLDVRGRLLTAQADAAAAHADAERNKAAQGPKLPQREDDTVVSIHQMMPLVNELLTKTQARLAAKPPAPNGMLGTLSTLPEKAGRLMTSGAYRMGLPVAPADSERIQLASLLQILGTVPYLRGIRNMQFVDQIQKHLADPSATDESLVERLTKLKEILPGMEQAIYDVHNQGVIPHKHEGAMAPAGSQEFDYVPGKGLVPRVKP